MQPAKVTGSAQPAMAPLTAPSPADMAESAKGAPASQMSEPTPARAKMPADQGKAAASLAVPAKPAEDAASRRSSGAGAASNEDAKAGRELEERLTNQPRAFSKAGRPSAAGQQAPTQIAAPQAMQQEAQTWSAQSTSIAQAGLLLWNPLVVTGEDGRAEIQFKLPDTATKCRVIVDAHANGRLGSVQFSVPAKSP